MDRSHDGPKAAVVAGAAKEKTGRPPATSQRSTQDHPDFDFTDLLDRVDGDRELATVVIHSFIQDVPSQIAAFRQALSGANAEERQRLAHGIKGASGSIGCRRMQELAGYAEYACRNGLLADAENVGTGLLAAFAEAENAIREAGF